MVETSRFSSNVQTYANLILETLILTTLSMFLFLYDPKSFIFVTTVALVVFFFRYSLKANLLNGRRKELFMRLKL